MSAPTTNPSILSVLSCSILFRMPFPEWTTKALKALKESFEDHGQVLPVSSGPKPTVERVRIEPFLNNLQSCSPMELFEELNRRGFQVHAAYWTEDKSPIPLRDGETEQKFRNNMDVRFLVCPYDEVVWTTERPFAKMQQSLGLACSMALYRGQVFDNDFHRGDEVVVGKRALAFNFDQPQWILSADGTPLPNAPRAKGKIDIIEDEVVAVRV